MNKRKILVTAVSMFLAFSFYTLYTNTIVLWDAYALEIDSADGIEPEYSIFVTGEDLENFPLVMSTLKEVDQNRFTVITFDDGDAILQFNEFIEVNEGSLDYGYVYIQIDESEYLVSMISYGGMDDEPVYLYLSGLMTLVAIGLVLSEIAARAHQSLFSRARRPGK